MSDVPNGVDNVGWKRLRRLAAISLTIAVVSGCGGTAVISSMSDAGSSIPTAINASDPTASVRYCQRLDDGQWVTNASANSTTPCVPDPSYATGDEQADAFVAVPRCFTCKPSDWNRAERHAALRAGRASAASTVAATATATNNWSPDTRSSFISDCSAYVGGHLCECLANHLEWQVPLNQAEGLSGDDPRVQVAAQECRS